MLHSLATEKIVVIRFGYPQPPTILDSRPSSTVQMKRRIYVLKSTMATTRIDTDQDDDSSENPIHENNSAPTTEMAAASVASIPSDNSSVVVVGVQLTYTLPSRHVDDDTERTTTTTTTTTHTVRFDARQCQPARMGLPPPPPPPTLSSTTTSSVTQSSLNHQPSLPLDQKVRVTCVSRRISIYSCS